MLPGNYGRALALAADGAAYMVDIKQVGAFLLSMLCGYSMLFFTSRVRTSLVGAYFVLRISYVGYAIWVFYHERNRTSLSDAHLVYMLDTPLRVCHHEQSRALLLRFIWMVVDTQKCKNHVLFECHSLDVLVG